MNNKEKNLKKSDEPCKVCSLFLRVERERKRRIRKEERKAYYEFSVQGTKSGTV